MNPAIRYNIDFDFTSYLNLCANVKDLRKQFNAKVKQDPGTCDKKCRRDTLAFYKEAEVYYNDILTYIQRNELDMFFKRIMIFNDFLMKLTLKGKRLENQTLEDFKAYALKVLDLTPDEVNSDKVYKALKYVYDIPDSNEDFAKETELILETFNNDRMFETSFKNAVASLKDTFITHRYLPEKDKIEAKLAENNKLFQANPIQYITNLSGGMIKEEELKGRTIQPYMTFATVFKLLLDIKEDTTLVIYRRDLEPENHAGSDEDQIQALLKFLSDGKRYKMVQMLAQKKWYANELAKEFGITPATMSYHINKMFALGLISFESGAQNKMYLELDKKRLNQLLGKVVNDLTES